MPTGPKKQAIRRADHIYADLDDAMIGFLELSRIFDPQHPEDGEFLRLMCKGILMIQESFSAWYLKNWNRPPGGQRPAPHRRTRDEDVGRTENGDSVGRPEGESKTA